MAAVSAPVTLSPENQVELATLTRMLELASGFTLAFVRVNHTSLRDRLAEAEEKVDGEIATLTRDREDSAAGIAAELLANYERLRARLGGVGAARLIGNHCDGCHLTLSSVELDRIRHLGEGEVFTCEQCSRILVPSKPSS